MAEPRDRINPSHTGGAGTSSGDTDKSHPVAAGVGALGGAAAGAAAGTLGGPVGAVVGAVAGAVVGGLGGSAVGRAFDPAEEDRYWRENYSREPYVEAGRPYDDYGPAYTLGMSARQTYGGRFDEAEDRLSQEWGRHRGGSSLSWEQAREPTRAAWRRVEQQYPLTEDGQLMGAQGSTVVSSREESSSSADLGTGLEGGRTYSASGEAAIPTPSSYEQGSTVRSLAGLTDLGGAVGSASASGRQDSDRTQDTRSKDKLSFANLPRTDSSMGSVLRDSQRGTDRSTAGSSAFGAVGAAQSATVGEVSDKDDVVDVLNDLIECCRDGEYGFELCAEHTQSPELKRRLSQHAQECRSAAHELMDCIRRLGGEVDDGGSMMGSMHRGWVSVRGTLAGYSDHAMLAEAERGEDTALARYHKALKEKLPPDVRSLVQRQADGVQRNHDDIKMWRDRLHDRG